MKIRNFLLMLAAVLCLGVACKKTGPENQGGKDNQQTEDPTGSTDPEVKPETAMTQEQIKQRLEEIGLEVLSYAELDKWKYGFESFYLMGSLITGNNPEGNGNHGENRFDTDVFEEIPADFVTEEKDADGYYNTTVDIRLSSLGGLYTFNEKDRAWEQDENEGDKLVFDAPYKDTHLVLTVSAEDYPDKVNVSSTQVYNHYWSTPEYHLEVNYELSEKRWDEQGRNDGLYYFTDPTTDETIGPMEYTYENTVRTLPPVEDVNKWREIINAYVPKKLDATLQRDGKDVMDITADVDYTCGNASKVFDPATDRLSVKADFTVQDYDLELKRVYFSSEEGGVQAALKYQDTNILTIDAKEKGMTMKREETHRENINMEEVEPGATPSWGNETVRDITTISEPTIPGEVELAIDVLGKLQIKGTADMAALVENTNKAFDEAKTDDEFKSYVAAAEQNMNLAAYFDGGTMAQATLGLEPDKETIDGRSRLVIVPVLRFADGTSYAVFQTFFNPDDFKTLVEAAENWAEGVEKYLTDIGVLRKEEAHPIDPEEDLNGDGIPDYQQDYDGDGTPDWMQ